jgi:hypothetical protein
MRSSHAEDLQSWAARHQAQNANVGQRDAVTEIHILKINGSVECECGIVDVGAVLQRQYMMGKCRSNKT